VSIRAEILIILGALVLVFALLAGILVPEYYESHAATSLRERAHAEASLLSNAVGPALEFEQQDVAEEILRAGLADPLVSWAAIYDAEGRRTVVVGEGRGRSRSQVDPREGAEGFTARTAYASSAVRRGDQPLGWVAVALQRDQIDAAVGEMRFLVLLVSLALAAGIMLLATFWVSRRVGRPLVDVTRAAERIASGDVSSVVQATDRRDEVGALSRAFNSMTSQLRGLVRRITAGADSLAGSAAGMFSEVREQESLATQQTASLEEIRRTLDALSRAAEQVEEDARTVREMAERSLSSSQQIAERTRLVSTHSDRIGEILQLIQDIADRADLLALNAALEGTKAGEVGRGFSLVAAEMRRLSEHVKDSVRDIRKLVADMREASHASVMATEEGIKLSRDTSAAAGKISDAVIRQREGTAQVKSSADEIVRVVNESLRGRAETTQSAEALLKLSQELKEAVAAFRLESGLPRDA
jgi:methyl-accepting chemotaxis protein